MFCETQNKHIRSFAYTRDHELSAVAVGRPNFEPHYGCARHRWKWAEEKEMTVMKDEKEKQKEEM